MKKNAAAKKAKAPAKKGKAETASVVEQIPSAAASTEIPVEDEQLAGTVKAGKGRNNDKYRIAGDSTLYGKGRIVQAAVRKYVAERPKVTVKQLKEVFPDELLARFGVFQDENGANNLASAGR